MPDTGRKTIQPKSNSDRQTKLLLFALHVADNIQRHSGPHPVRKTYKQIAESLNAAGVKSARGKVAWSAKSVSHCLKRIRDYKYASDIHEALEVDDAIDCAISQETHCSD
ncbi:MAG: hypothetical protein PHY09_11295 [Desulfuromonadaceae bacterium]|nr:hypothetical protein [Desulfuromonadaceae bacterium]MDD5106126.1 hypothetical protein [Desulfuromonadaceae bacterium]